MRSKTAIFFEAKVRLEKTMEDGVTRKVHETYAVDAMSFAEAEERAKKEAEAYTSGELDVVGLKIAPYTEVFFSDDDSDDAWFRVKLAFITIDERTQKERKSKVNYLVNASSIERATENVKKIMKDTMIDYEIVSINDTSIIDVFEYAKLVKGE